MLYFPSRTLDHSYLSSTHDNSGLKEEREVKEEVEGVVQEEEEAKEKRGKTQGGGGRRR